MRSWLMEPGERTPAIVSGKICSGGVTHSLPHVDQRPRSRRREAAIGRPTAHGFPDPPSIPRTIPAVHTVRLIEASGVASGAGGEAGGLLALKLERWGCLPLPPNANILSASGARMHFRGTRFVVRPRIYMMVEELSLWGSNLYGRKGQPISHPKRSRALIQ